MPSFEPPDPDFAAKVRDSFARQPVMALFGARLVTVEPGRVEIGFARREDLTQQHGFVHAGVTSAIADSAGGYAAFSLMPAGSTVLTVEYKVNLLAPAAGERFLAIGRVVKPGRRVFTCELEVRPVEADAGAATGALGEPCLIGMQTALCLPGRDGPPDAGR